MGRRKKGEPPEYRKHKRRGGAEGYAVDQGHRVYFPGKHGSAESRAAYEEYRRSWLAANQPGRQPIPSGCLVGELAKRYEDHAREYYRRPDGSPTDELRNLKMSMVQLLALYDVTEANAFTPEMLRDVRDAMTRDELSKNVINQRVGRIRRMFRWGVTERAVRGEVLTDLERLPDLPRGRGSVRETKRVLHVEWERVRATLPYLGRPELKALVMLQWWTGARPGQVCHIRGEDVFTGGIVTVGRKVLRVPDGFWLWVIGAKMAHLRADEDRLEYYPLNRKAQSVLRRWLRPEGYLLASSRADHYGRTSYHAAVTRASEAAGVPHWHPHQIRHSAYIRLQMLGGSEAAGLCLNHRADLSDVYGQKEIERAASHLRGLPLRLN